MFCGRATVSTDVGAVVEVIGGTGLVVPPRNPRALAEACVALLRDPERRERLGAAARARALELFTVEQNITAFHGIYLEIVSRTPGPPGRPRRRRRTPALRRTPPRPMCPAAGPSAAHAWWPRWPGRGPPRRTACSRTAAELGDRDARPRRRAAPGRARDAPARGVARRSRTRRRGDERRRRGAASSGGLRRTEARRRLRPPTELGPRAPASAARRHPRATDPGRSAPAARGAADPVKALMHRHRDLCERAVDPLEIAAGLEAHGVTDRTAARFRHRDVFSLAEEMYARVPRATATRPPRRPRRPRHPAPARRLGPPRPPARRPVRGDRGRPAPHRRPGPPGRRRGGRPRRRPGPARGPARGPLPPPTAHARDRHLHLDVLAPRLRPPRRRPARGGR